MAFDKSMLLTYLAVVLVVVTGAVFAINGDFSDDVEKSGLEVGDYAELTITQSINEEEPVIQKILSVVTAVEIDDEGKESIRYDRYIDDEYKGEFVTDPYTFLSAVTYVDGVLEPVAVHTETVSTELGIRECRIYNYELESEGYTIEASTYVGVEDGYLYYQNSTSVSEEETVVQEIALTGISLSI